MYTFSFHDWQKYQTPSLPELDLCVCFRENSALQLPGHNECQPLHFDLVSSYDLARAKANVFVLHFCCLPSQVILELSQNFDG